MSKKKKQKDNTKKIWLFIDQANLWSAYKKVWKMIDFKKLVNYIEREFNWKLEFKNIYFAYPKEWTRDYNVKWIHNFGIKLKKELWFQVKKKPLKTIIVKDSYWNPVTIEKGNMDIELTMDVMQTWHHFDIMVLFSWDSDFYNLVLFLLFKQKKVYVFSTENNISFELKHHSSKYYDFCDIKEIWGAKLKHRAEIKAIEKP
jgi:uncharacterized LabA/DUF88 family protein